MKNHQSSIINHKWLVLVLFALLGALPLSAKPNKQTVVLSCDIHCQGCCDKVMKNIAYEKGVKDIICDLKTKTVTVTYDANKTDVPALLKAFDKIGKPAKVKADGEKQESKTAPMTTDADTGASTPY